MNKKYTAVKTLFVNLRPGINYLPDDQTLKGRIIQTIIPCEGLITPDGKQSFNDIENVYINLTSNAVDYFVKNVPLTNLSKQIKKGNYTQYNRTLSLQDCYVNNTTSTSGILILVIFYEDYSNASSDVYLSSRYESFEIPVTSVSGKRVYLPDNLSLVGVKFSNLMISTATKSYTHKTVINEDISQNTYITLCKGTQVVWEQMPLYLLNQYYDYKLLDFSNIQFDFQNSYVQLATTDETNIGKVILLTAKYNK